MPGVMTPPPPIRCVVEGANSIGLSSCHGGSRRLGGNPGCWAAARAAIGCWGQELVGLTRATAVTGTVNFG